MPRPDGKSVNVYVRLGARDLVIVEAPYHERWVRDFKREVPRSRRRWDPETERWYLRRMTDIPAVIRAGRERGWVTRVHRENGMVFEYPPLGPARKMKQENLFDGAGG